MQNYLANILYSTTKKENEINLISLFKDMINIFKTDNSIYKEVVESALVDLPSLRGSKETDNVKFFNKKGVLLFDGMRAAAGGHMSYIYRAKGMRLYLFEDDSIGMFSVYCTIDNDGFQYWLEDGFGLDSINSITSDDVKRYLSMFDNLEFRDFQQTPYSQKLLYIMTQIKHNYDIAYYLEYALYPPDVDVLSPFSKLMRKTIWDIALSESFENTYGRNIQIKLINELSHLEIPPSPNQLTDYLKRQFDDKKLDAKFDEIAELFMSRLNSIDNKMEDVSDLVKDMEVENKIRHEEVMEEDIVDLKPNFWGIGVNLKELLRRILKRKK